MQLSNRQVRGTAILQVHARLKAKKKEADNLLLQLFDDPDFVPADHIKAITNIARLRSDRREKYDRLAQTLRKKFRRL